MHSKCNIRGKKGIPTTLDLHMDDKEYHMIEWVISGRLIFATPSCDHTKSRGCPEMSLISCSENAKLKCLLLGSILPQKSPVLLFRKCSTK